jgi:DNA invertase Pin-like site-specific DNA recombinase
MFIRAYLRASTDDQDANRARKTLQSFAADQGIRIAAFYMENASGTTVERSELMRLLSDASPGDVLLIESVDRLTRLPRPAWEQLRNQITAAGLQVVALDLPITHAVLKPTGDDGIQEWMLKAISQMFLEFMAAFARKDYDTRRERQVQGIEKAKQIGLYRGRRPNHEQRRNIQECLKKGFSVRKTAELLGCSTSTVARLKREVT